MINDSLEQVDPEVFEAIHKESERLECNLELIASENVVSEAVLEAQGSLMTNKYAEGYPGRRYYGAASTWTWWSAWRWNGPGNSSARST